MNPGERRWSYSERLVVIHLRYPQLVARTVSPAREESFRDRMLEAESIRIFVNVTGMLTVVRLRRPCHYNPSLPVS